MSAQILNGEVVAAGIREAISKQVSEISQSGGGVGLGTILVGDDGPSSNYVAMKHKDCAEVGISSFHTHLPQDASMKDVLSAVEDFNSDERIHSFLVQLPLPKHLDEETVLVAMDPRKDVDGLHPLNLGLLALGRPGPLPCTPAGIVELLLHYGVEIEGSHVVIVGRGVTVGRPLSILLALDKRGGNAAVTVVHSKVGKLLEIVRSADIVISGAGRPGLITKEMVRPGAVVVGAGTSWEGRRLLSDISEEVGEVASWITPRIGGVGPMTRAMLLSNAVRAARLANGSRW